MKKNTIGNRKVIRKRLARAFGGHSQYSGEELGNAILGVFNNSFPIEGDDEYVSVYAAFIAVLDEAMQQEEEYWQDDIYDISQSQKSELLKRAKEWLK